jgi:hypothetical protein
MSLFNRVTHAVIKPISKNSSGLDRMVDNNKWLKMLSTAGGGEVWRNGMRTLEKKDINDLNGDDYRNMADSVSVYRSYKQQQRSANHAASAAERGSQQYQQGGEDASIADIRRAYGMEDDGSEAFDAQLQGWIADADKRLALPKFQIFGREREQLQQNRAKLAELASQVQANRAGSPAAMAKMAIDAMAGRASSASKRDATRELDTRLASSLTQQNAAAYTRGVQGSSFDKAAQAAAVGDYERGRVGIDNTLAASDRGFRTKLDDQRVALEDKVRSGAIKSRDPAATLTEQQGAATSAYDGLTDRAIGKLLATSADLGVNDAVQRRQGNAGFSGLTTARPVTSSRGTFGSLSRG